MKIRFHGPIGRVTGSCYHLRHGETELLVDCGLRQEGLPGDEVWNRGDWPFDPARLTAVVLTHAHVDHCGLLPRLLLDGFRGPIYASRPTGRLARHILRDAQRRGAPYRAADVGKVRFRPVAGGKLGRAQRIAPDVYLVLHRAGHILGAVSPQIIWGPSEGPQRSVTFSGDLGPNVAGARMQALNRHAANPYITRPGGAPYARSYAVLESTYGDRPRPEGALAREARLAALMREIRRAVAGGGVLLIPAFAMERTPALLFDLAVLRARHMDELRDLPVYLHAPLARRLLPEYGKGLVETGSRADGGARPRWLGEDAVRLLGLDPGDYADLDLALRVVGHFFSDKKHWWPADVSGCERPGAERVAERFIPTFTAVGERPGDLDQPAIVVTGGGMMDGGAVGAYADLLERPSTVLALAGFASRSSNAARICDAARVSPEARQALRGVCRFGDKQDAPTLALRDLACQVVSLDGYSGHADQRRLVDWVYRVHKGIPETVADRVFLTHGSDPARRALAAALEQRRSGQVGRRWKPAEVEVPTAADGWFDLDRDEWDDDPEEELARLLLERGRIERRIDELVAAGVGKQSA